MRWSATRLQPDAHRTVQVWLWRPKTVEGQRVWLEHVDRVDKAATVDGRLAWVPAGYELRRQWMINWWLVGLAVACAALLWGLL